MADYDPSDPPDYNSMQQQMGLFPPLFQPPPIPFPGQVSAAMAQGGVNGAFMTNGSVGTSFGAGMFPGQQRQGFTNQGPMFQGPTGVMMPMNPAMYGGYPGVNPYANYNGQGLFTPIAAAPPPVYGGQMGQTFFQPPPASAQFNTAYGANFARQQLTDDTMYTGGLAYAGVGARLGTNALGAMGGAMLGRRLGGGPGAVLGALAGFMGFEGAGIGEGGQNAFMNNIAAPLIQQRGMAGGIQEMSRGFISSGAGLNETGAGFTRNAAANVSRSLRDMASSASFQRETGERFNQQDLLKIFQGSAQNDLMGGAQSAAQVTTRVREVAKSLNLFMSMAQEPDVQRAIQTMGQLRSSGLNLNETNQAVTQGRAFARMAGQSFGDMMNGAGAIGAQTFQSMGLTQGLGMQTGMMNYALARGSQNIGALGPQLLNLVGGAQGLSNLNNVFGASMLQMPMLAPSVMSSAGGINSSALQSLLSGGSDPFRQTTQATSALQAMTGRQGVGGLGMAIAMQPLVQDTIGRAMQAQGPFGQRNFEDRNIMGLMRQMGLSGSGGFATAAQAMGMERSQAVARMQELSSPLYYDQQRAQIEATRQEARQEEIARREAMAPNIFGTLARGVGFDPSASLRGAGRAVRGFFELDSRSGYTPDNAVDARRDLEDVRSADYGRHLREDTAAARSRAPADLNIYDRYRISQGRGYQGVAAGLSALIGGFGSQAAQRGEMADQAAGSRGLGLITSASNAEVARGLRSMDSAFGAEDALRISQGMTSRVLTNLGRGANDNMLLGPRGNAIINGVTRGAAAVGGGMVGGVAGFVLGGSDIGNIFQSRQTTGSDLRTAFVNAGVASGRTAEEMGAFYDRDPSAAAQSIANRVQARMTPEERDALFDQARRSQGLGEGQGSQADIQRERVARTRRGLFGGESAELQDEYLRTRGNIRGVSREGPQLEKERDYIMRSAMLSSARSRGTPEERARLDRQLDDLEREGQRSGILTSENTAAIQSQITSATNRMSDGTGLDLARGFAGAHVGTSGQDILSSAASDNAALRRDRLDTRIKGGFAALARGSGPLADALQAARANDPSQYNEGRVMEAFRGLDEEAIAQLTPDQQRAVRNLSSSNTRVREQAEGTIRGFAYERGARAETLRRRYGEKNPLERAFFGFFGMRNQVEEEYVQAGMGRTTDADRRADEAEASTSSVASMFSGLGGGGEMVEAARDLKRVAEIFEGVVQSGALDRVVGD